MPEPTKTSPAVASFEDAQAVVRAMFDAAAAGDLERFRRCWADDAVWHNMPLAPVRGADAITRWWTPMLQRPGNFRAEIMHISSDGGTVLTERIDYINARGLNIVAPVSGVFEVRGGRIIANREYWDFMSALRMTMRKVLGRADESAIREHAKTAPAAQA